MSAHLSNVNAQCIAFAGNDTTVCGNTVNLHGTWSHNIGADLLWTSTNPYIAFSNPTSENTTATLIAFTQNQDTVQIVFTETISPSICVSSDTVIIVFCQQQISNAGTDFTSCGTNASLSAISLCSGYWTCSQSNVIFLPDFYSPNADVIIPPYITPAYNIVFTWHETCGPCISSDNVTVTFIKPPHVEAGPAQAVCGYMTALIADTLGSGIISGSWSCNIPGVTFTTTGGGIVPAAYSDVNASGASGQFVNSKLEAYCYWTVVSGFSGCTNTDSVLVTFYEIPDAYAGIVCGKTYDLIGQYSLDNPTGNWTVLTRPWVTSTQLFIPNNTPNGEVFVSDCGIWQFIWTESNAGNSSCFDMDTITINFMTIPHPDAGGHYYVSGHYILLSATVTPGATGYWQAYYNNWYDASVWPADTVLCPSCNTSPSVVYYSPDIDTIVDIFYMEYNWMCYGYDTAIVHFFPLSISDIRNEYDLIVYPNPVESILHWSSDLKTENIVVNTLDGRIIYSAEKPVQNSIATETLNTGIYIITIRTKNGVFNTRFVKE